MAAFNIPLEVKSPNIENPFQAQQQAVGIKGMLQDRELKQQQLQANQMAMQEKALQQASQRALNQAIQANMKSGPDGSINVDHDGVVRSLGQLGYGSMIPGYQGNAIKIQTEQAKLTSDKLKNQADSAEQISQALQAVKDDASYQAILPHLDAITNGMRQSGMQLPQPPRQYDPTYVAATSATGMKIADGLRKMHDASTLAQEAPKTAEAWKKLADETLSTARDDGDYGSKISMLKARGMPGDMLDSYGNSYSPEKVAQLKENLIPPQDREKIFQTRIADAGNLLKARGDTPAGYTRAYDSIQDPRVRALFPKPEDWSPKAADEAFAIATTPAQKIQEREAQARIAETGTQHAETKRHNQEMEGLTQQLRDVQQQRADNTGTHETVAQHHERVSKLADQAIAESTQSGGRSIDDALRNVQNPDFYQNHPIGNLRGEVAKELQSRKGADLGLQQKENKIEAGDQLGGIEKIRWMKDHPGQPIPTKSQLKQQQQPAAVAPRPNAAPQAKPATQQPSAAPKVASETYSAGGKTFKKGDPIKFRGDDREFIFQGVDAQGKVLAVPR